MCNALTVNGLVVAVIDVRSLRVQIPVRLIRYCYKTS